MRGRKESLSYLFGMRDAAIFRITSGNHLLNYIAMGMLLEAADMDTHEEIKSLLCLDLTEEEVAFCLKEMSELLQKSRVNYVNQAA